MGLQLPRSSFARQLVQIVGPICFCFPVLTDLRILLNAWRVPSNQIGLAVFIPCLNVFVKLALLVLDQALVDVMSVD